MPSKQEIKSLKIRALQTEDPPAYEAKNKVRRLYGDPLTKPIYWQGKQWAVTAFGIEARDGSYPIKSDRIWDDNDEHGWIDQIAENGRFNVRDFAEALRLARQRWPQNVKKRRQA